MGAEYSDEFFAGELVPKKTYEKSPKPTKLVEEKEESVEDVEALEEQIEAIIATVRDADGKNYSSEFFDQYYKMIRIRVDQLGREMKKGGYQLNNPRFRNTFIESNLKVDEKKAIIQFGLPHDHEGFKDETIFLGRIIFPN